MSFKILSLFLVISAPTSFGLSLDTSNRSGHAEIQQDLGPELNATLAPIIAGLPDPILIPIPNGGQISIDLGQIAPVLGIPLVGSANISSISLAGQSDIAIKKLYVNLDGLFNDIPISAVVKTNPTVHLELNCTVNALISNIIPIRGNGIVSVGLKDMEFGVDAAIKNFVMHMKDPLVMTTFAYSLDIPSLYINLGELLEKGNADFGKAVGDALAQILNPTIIPVVNSIVADLLQDWPQDFNDLKLTIEQLQDLLKPKPLELQDLAFLSSKIQSYFAQE